MRRSRSIICALMIALGVVPIAHAAQNNGIAGNWVGSIDAGGNTIEMIYRITQSESGALNGTMDVPSQGGYGIALMGITVDGNAVRWEIDLPGGAGFKGTLDAAGKKISGLFKQGAASIPITLKPRTEEAGPSRPQEPVPPFPYRSSDLEFESAESGVRLSGTLFVPDGRGPFPGVALASGSGPHDRDSSMMGHRPFLVLADALARRGVAVLRYDDRGVGASGGTFDTANPEDFAADAIGALRAIASAARIDSERVGLLGHSEGAIAVYLAAERSDKIVFAITLAGTGLPGVEALLASAAATAEASGMPKRYADTQVGVLAAIARAVIESGGTEGGVQQIIEAAQQDLDKLDPDARAAMGLTDTAIEILAGELATPNSRYVLEFDPIPVLERFGAPVLALYGSRDPITPVSLHEPPVREALARSGDERSGVLVLEGLNHMFQDAKTGAPSEFGRIEQTMSPVVFDTIASWIRSATQVEQGVGG
ncbi:MAG: alpha/beta fold hydrolase [Phycisphaerales bacterium]